VETTNVVESAVLSSLSKVPPFPPIATRLLVLLADESVGIGDVADLIASDPTFSARILQYVNSPAFALPHPVSDVSRALGLLGLDHARQVTLTLAANAYANGALRTAELRRSWEHTVATAILADQIARACGVFTDVAYTAGIIHDIGRLGLLVAYPMEYQRIIRDAADRCLDLLDFESEQFGIHHAEAGRILAERWGLPDEFRIVAGRHHDACEGRELDLLRIVHVACRLADALGYDFTRPLIPPDIEMILASLPDAARQRFQMPAAELRAVIEQRIRAYDGPDDDGQVRASDPEETQPSADEAHERDPDPGLNVTVWIVAGIGLVVVSALLLLR